MSLVRRTQCKQTIMRILFLTLLAAIVNIQATTHVSPTIVNPNAVLRQLFEILRKAIKNGNSEYEVPIMDPITFSRHEVIIQNSSLSLQANFTKGYIRGLGDFQLKDISLIREKVALDIHIIFPGLIFESGYYQMNGSLFGMLPVYGKGRMRIETVYLEIKSRIYLKPSDNGKSTLIKELEKPTFNVNRILSHSDFDGDMDCVVNRIIKEVLSSYLNRFNKYLARAYSDAATKTLNQFLIKFDTWRIIATLL